MKLIAALVLALVLNAGAGVRVETSGLTLNQMEDKGAAVWGLVEEVREDRIVMIDQYGARVQANLGDDTRWIGETPQPGDCVMVVFDGARTRGIPAQVWAQAVVCRWIDGTAADGPALLTESGDISLSLLRLGGDWPEGIAPGDAVRVYYPVDGELLDVFGVVKAE